MPGLKPHNEIFATKAGWWFTFHVANHGAKKLDLTNWVRSNGDLDLLLIYSGVDTHTEI